MHGKFHWKCIINTSTAARSIFILESPISSHANMNQISMQMLWFITYEIIRTYKNFQWLLSLNSWANVWELKAWGHFFVNKNEGFWQINAVQLTFKVTLRTPLNIKMREVISIHVGQAGCQMGKLEIKLFTSYSVVYRLYNTACIIQRFTAW